MSDQGPGGKAADEVDLPPDIPSEVWQRLRQAGVTLNDNERVRAAAIAYLVGRGIEERLEFDHLSAALKESAARAIPRRDFRLDVESGKYEVTGQALEKPSFIFPIIGLACAIAALIASFSSFYTAIKELIHGKASLGDLFVSSAFAQQVAAVAPPTAQVSTVIVYSIYFLLGIAYVMSIYVVYLQDNTKIPTRVTRATKMLELLTSFFIGVAGGKVI